MLTTRKQYDQVQFFSSQPKKDYHSSYESFPRFTEIKGHDLIIDGDELPNNSDLKALSDVATEIYKLYGLLDNRHHDFTLVTLGLERLFTMLHWGAYGDYLHKHNFVAEVERFARTEEVTYVPQKTLSKGGMFELKPVAGFITSSSSLPPVSSSEGPYSYGK